MFHLEQAIAEWRQQMLAAGIKMPVPLEELEIHLREEIEQRLKAGAGEQQAFDVAVQQIGKSEMLKNEFSKVEGTKEARDYKLTQILSVVCAGFVPLWFGGMMLFNRGGFEQLTPRQQMSGVAATVIFSVFVWSGRLGYRLLPVIHTKLVRSALCLAPIIFWWITFFRVIVPHYDFTIGQFVVMILWGFITPSGAFLGLVWGLETAAHKSRATSH
jgi:hypothetical protein